MGASHETRETAANRRARRGAVLAEQRQQAKRDVASARGAVVELRAQRRELLKRVRTQCAAARLRARAAARERRREAMAALKVELAELRAAERERCRCRKTKVRLELGKRIGEKLQALDETRAAQAAARRVDQHRAKAERRITRAEQRGESDDEVRANIDAELLPVFDRVRARIRARPGASRTEAFTQWVEENPHEVWAMREELSERRLRELLREQEKAEREHMRAAGRARQAAAGMRVRRADLPAAPF